MEKKARQFRTVRTGFGLGGAVALIAAWVEWKGWTSGSKSIAVTDFWMGAFLLVVWIAWEIYERFGKASRS